jgi:hypothetical protein
MQATRLRDPTPSLTDGPSISSSSGTSPSQLGSNAFIRGGEDDDEAVRERPGRGLRLHGLTFHGMSDVQAPLGRVQSVLNDLVGILHQGVP